MQCAFLLKRSLPCQKDNSYRIDKPIFLFQCCTIIQKNIQHDSSTKCIKKEQEITTFSTLIQSLKNNTNRTVLIRVKNSNLNILQKNPTNPIHPSISLSKTFRKKKRKKTFSTDKYQQPFIPLPLRNEKKREKKTALDSTRLDSRTERSDGGARRGPSQPFSPRQSPVVEAVAEGTRILQTPWRPTPLYNLSPSSRIPREGERREDCEYRRKEIPPPPPLERKWSDGGDGGERVKRWRKLCKGCAGQDY